MKNTSTTLEIPEGSKATIQGKVINGKNYLVVEVEQEPELKEGDMAIFWDHTSCEAIIAPYKLFDDGSYVDHLAMYWDNALKWDGTKEQYERVLTNSKDTLVSKIKQRIESEYRKHPDLDWAEIAARKIYAEIFEDKKQ